MASTTASSDAESASSNAMPTEPSFELPSFANMEVLMDNIVLVQGMIDRTIRNQIGWAECLGLDAVGRHDIAKLISADLKYKDIPVPTWICLAYIEQRLYRNLMIKEEQRPVIEPPLLQLVVPIARIVMEKVMSFSVVDRALILDVFAKSLLALFPWPVHLDELNCVTNGLARRMASANKYTLATTAASGSDGDEPVHVEESDRPKPPRPGPYKKTLSFDNGLKRNLWTRDCATRDPNDTTNWPLYDPRFLPPITRSHPCDPSGLTSFPRDVVLAPRPIAPVAEAGISKLKKAMYWPANFDSNGNVRPGLSKRGKQARSYDGRLLEIEVGAFNPAVFETLSGDKRIPMNRIMLDVAKQHTRAPLNTTARIFNYDSKWEHFDGSRRFANWVQPRYESIGVHNDNGRLLLTCSIWIIVSGLAVRGRRYLQTVSVTDPSHFPRIYRLCEKIDRDLTPRRLRKIQKEISTVSGSYQSLETMWAALTRNKIGSKIGSKTPSKTPTKIPSTSAPVHPSPAYLNSAARWFLDAKFLRSFPHGYEVIETPGEDLLYGLHAIRLSLVEQQPNIPPLPDIKLLQAIVTSPEAKSKMALPTKFESGGVHDTNHFTIDHLRIIWAIFKKRYNLDLPLGIVMATRKQEVASDKDQQELAFWVHHDGVDHWSGIRPKTPSKNGKHSGDLLQNPILKKAKVVENTQSEIGTGQSAQVPTKASTPSSIIYYNLWSATPGSPSSNKDSGVIMTSSNNPSEAPQPSNSADVVVISSDEEIQAEPEESSLNSPLNPLVHGANLSPISPKTWANGDEFSSEGEPVGTALSAPYLEPDTDEDDEDIAWGFDFKAIETIANQLMGKPASEATDSASSTTSSGAEPDSDSNAKSASTLTFIPEDNSDADNSYSDDTNYNGFASTNESESDTPTPTSNPKSGGISTFFAEDNSDADNSDSDGSTFQGFN